MDPKAAAKSKRSQSQQAKKSHPTPSAVSSRSQQKKKEAIPQQKKPQNQGEQKVRGDLRALPSNWDRYEEDGIESDSEGFPPPPLPMSSSSSVDAETVARKSRGADFVRLIAEARSQLRDRDHGVIMSSLASDYPFDEAIPDLSCLVSIRGDSLVSRCSNDNFSVDINAGSSFEVPFLSLDLNSLATEISKVSLAERLFIDEDFLPAEPVSFPLIRSKQEYPEEVDRVNKSHETGVESRPLCANSVLSEISVDDLLDDFDFLTTEPTTDGHVGHGSTLFSLEKDDRVNQSPETSVESQPPYPRPVLAESSVDDLLADFVLPPCGNIPGEQMQHRPTLSSVDESIDDLLAETSFDMGLERQSPRGKFYKQ